MQATVLAPIAPELTAPRHSLGAPTGVLSQALDEALSVDQVLLRMRIEGCQIAKAMPVTTPGMPSSTDPAAYKPKTEFDNTPWRFDMSQNGKRMTAEEFDSWLKAKGVRVAKGAAPVVAPHRCRPGTQHRCQQPLCQQPLRQHLLRQHPSCHHATDLHGVARRSRLIP